MLEFPRMSDTRRRAPDVTSLTLHDKKMVQEPRSEWTLVARPPIALTDITSGIVPYRPNMTNDSVEVKAMWGTLAQAPLSVFSASRIDGANPETIMVGPRLTAHQVNGLLYLAAPYKGFGFDTYDIIGDWKALYDDPNHAKRKKLHAKMPGWDQFEASRELILGVLERNYSGDFRSQDTSDVVIPVLRWRRTIDGNNRIVLESMDERLQAALAEALPNQLGDASRFDNGMGLMYAAAYSPENTDWMPRTSYELSESPDTQVVGPTQVLAYAYRQIVKQHANPDKISIDQDVQASFLLDGLRSYAETGDMPVLDIVGDPVDSFFPQRPTRRYFDRVDQVIPTMQSLFLNADAIDVSQGQFYLPEATVEDIELTIENIKYNNIKLPTQLPTIEFYQPKYGEEVTIVDFTSPIKLEKNNLLGSGLPKMESTIIPKNSISSNLKKGL